MVLAGTLTTIEFQREALEDADINKLLLESMSDAGKVLKKRQKNMDIDKVEDLMDEVREQQQIAEEISSAISNPIAFGQDVDEDELMKELEELEQEELDKQLLETGEPEKLPDVPTAELPSVVAQKSKSSKSLQQCALSNLFHPLSRFTFH